MTTQHVRAALAVALLGLVTAMSPRPARADEVPKRLVYATYKNETSAMDVFNVLRDAERQNLIRIDSYAVVSKGLDGKVRVRDQRQGVSMAHNWLRGIPLCCWGTGEILVLFIGCPPALRYPVLAKRWAR